jgi:hypothetical protein
MESLEIDIALANFFLRFRQAIACDRQKCVLQDSLLPIQRAASRERVAIRAREFFGPKKRRRESGETKPRLTH